MAQLFFVLFSTLAAFFEALLFVRAALHKLGDRHRFEGVLTDYAVLPEGLPRLFAYAVPVLELTAAVLLILPTMRPVGAALAGGLLASYGVAMATNLVRGRYLIDCGCGGAPEPISWLLVARNVVLVALIAPTAAALVPTTTSGLAGDGAALGMALLLLLLWLGAEAAFSNGRRMNAALPSPTITWSAS